MKRSLSSTSNSQNLAFLSSENKSITNEFGVNTTGGTNSSSHVSSTLGVDEVQIDQDDLEELDIRWQVAMLTVRVQRFIKKTGRNLDFKGKQHVTFDKSQVECYNCHRKGHFAKECKSGWNQGKRSYGDNGRRNATTNEPSSQALVAQDGLGGYDWSNDFDEPVNYALMAISSSSSSSSSDNEVQNCSKQCLESFKTLQKNYDSEREKHSRARLEIQGYELALESLESRILGHEKNELAWGEKYEFQNYELKCRELKINNLNMELEKVVKERDELNIKIAKWEESSKSLNILLNSQMSAHDKNGLGYGTQLNEMSDKSETDSEISMSVFEVRSSDEESTPANDRFSKVDGYHVVPPLITGNFLTLRADISFAGLDEYAIRKKIIESKTTELNADTSKSKTSETVGNTNEVNVEKPKSVNESVVSTPNINKDKVIIEDWNSDDEDDVSEVSPVKTNETQTAKTQVDKIGQTSKKEGIGFQKIKACFVSRDLFTVSCNLDSGCSSHITGNKAYLCQIMKISTEAFVLLSQEDIAAEQSLKDDLRGVGSINGSASPVLVDLPYGKKVNKRDERSIVVKNKSRLIAQGFRQEDGIDYDEVFAPVAMIEAIRLFLAFASYMGFTVYQMDVKSAFLYGTISEEVYVQQPPGFVDPAHPNKVYKVIKALYGLHQAPRAWYETLSSLLIKMVSGKRFQVTLKASHLNAIKRIFRYLKHQPKIGLWYPMDSPFELEAFSDSDYGGASLDRKSTTGGCQFLGRRLISWQCKKQMIL
ncbi:putative ribonuclease H-like domain-containing protein [Tanacetum coccineum]|uniref:Ribonuclease H-like domain-containing protein n=1 Tax=Tanacetum coccineum TaxID=301880 RepID=A0ABQ5BPQ6_9ASTR